MSLVVRTDKQSFLLEHLQYLVFAQVWAQLSVFGMNLKANNNDTHVAHIDAAIQVLDGHASCPGHVSCARLCLQVLSHSSVVSTSGDSSQIGRHSQLPAHTRMALNSCASHARGHARQRT